MFAIGEIIDILIMSAALGFIFMGIFKKNPYSLNTKRFNWDDFKFAVLVTAPAVIFHELGHKFVALAFGLSATFKAAYTFLGLGIVLRLMNVGFIFFVPAYVQISGNATPLQYSITAFAGPLVNLILFTVAYIAIKQNPVHKWKMFWILTKNINLFLFIFNMIPLFGFDGQKVFSGLFQHFNIF